MSVSMDYVYQRDLSAFRRRNKFIGMQAEYFGSVIEGIFGWLHAHNLIGSSQKGAASVGEITRFARPRLDAAILSQAFVLLLRLSRDTFGFEGDSSAGRWARSWSATKEGFKWA